MVAAIAHVTRVAAAWAARVATVAAVTLAVLVTLAAGHAQAFPGVCGPTPPSAETVAAQVPGERPDRYGIGPDVSPFTSGSASSVYSRYGHAGLRFVVYDQGCTPDPAANITTFLANTMMDAAWMTAAFSSRITGAAVNPTYLSIFDPLISNVVQTLYDNVFLSLGAVTLLVVGLAMLWVGRAGEISRTATYAATAALVFIGVTLLAGYPVKAGHAVDRAATGVVTAVNQKLTGKGPGGEPPRVAVQSSLSEQVLYPAWVRGTFGSTGSPAAKQYAGKLFDAQTFTRRETIRFYNEDPASRREMLEQKRQQYTQVAKQIKQTDPNAYEHLRGNHGDGRMVAAFLAMVATIGGTALLILSGVLLILALLTVRLTVMLAPMFAVLAMHHRFVGVLTGVVNTTARAVVMAVAASIVAALNITALGTILASTEVAWWLRLLLLVLVPIGAFMLVWKWRRHVRVSKVDGGATKTTGGVVKRAAKFAAKKYVGGGITGSVIADKLDDKFSTRHGPAAQRPPARPEADPAPPPAAPSGPQMSPSRSAPELNPGPGTWVENEPDARGARPARVDPRTTDGAPDGVLVAHRGDDGAYRITDAEAGAAPRSRFDPRTGFVSSRKEDD